MPFGSPQNADDEKTFSTASLGVVILRNRLGLALVLTYFAHAIASVAYAATLADPKGQAAWIAAPIIFTPSFLFELLPPVTGPKSYGTWYLQMLVRYPVGFSFCSVALYLVGWLLQRICRMGLWFSGAVGAFIGLAIGCVWFVASINHSNYATWWFALGLVGAISGVFLHSMSVASERHP
jgi:hypothetical protein